MPFFPISDFYDLKIINNIFFFIFEGGLIFLSRGVYNSFSCNSLYIYIYSPEAEVYSIRCAICNKLYIGETSRPLKKRFLEHKQAFFKKRH